MYIAVGGANIQIVHYFDQGYLEEEKSGISKVSPELRTRVQMSPEAQNDIKMEIGVTPEIYSLSGDCKRNVNYETRMKNSG